MVTDEDYQASGEKLKSDLTFPDDSSASQPADASINTSDRTTEESISNLAAPLHTRSHISTIKHLTLDC
jgi:hypothetical protein